MNSLRPLLRLAWREVTRHKARAALVVGLVALMVGSAVAAATIVRTTTSTEEDFLASEFGAADAIVHISNSLDDSFFDGLSEAELEAALTTGRFELTDNNIADVAAAAEEVLGGQSTIARSAWPDINQQTDGPFSTFRGASLNIAALDLNDTVFDGRYELLEGRLPQSDAETVLTPRALQTQDVVVGDRLVIAETEFTIVGEVARAGSSFSGIAVLSPAGFDRLELDSQLISSEILLAGSNINLGAEFEATNEIAVAADVPPSQLRVSNRATYETGFFGRREGFVDAGRPEQLSTLVAALFAVQVALVAAAAFAVGVARRTRQFGQLQATGADNLQLRRTVLLEAGVNGLLGAAIGSALGLGVTALAWSQGWLDTVGERFPFDLRWNVIDLIGPAAVGILAAVAAAWWPTRKLRTLAPASALADHLPMTEPKVNAPLVGLLALIGGTFLLIAVTSTQQFYDSGDLGAALLVVSVLAMFGGSLSVIGLLIHRIGERADRFPLLARIVTRNSARHQGRSWVAVAALVAVVVLPIVIGASTKAYPTSYSTGPDENGWVNVNVETDGEIEGLDTFFADLGEGVEDEIEPVQQFTVVRERYQATGLPSYFTLVSEAERSRQSEGFFSGPQLDAVRATPGVLAALDLDTSFWENPSAPEALVAFGSRSSLRANESTLVRDDIELTHELVSAPFLDYESWVLVPPSVEEQFDLVMDPRSLHVELGRVVNDGDEATIVAIANDSWAATVDIDPFEFNNDENFLGTWVDIGNDSGGLTATQAAWVAIGGFTALAIFISIVTSALAAVEVDKEISTMIAAGAPPSMRRRLLGAQTAYHLFLAALIGIPLAVLLFWAATRADDFGPTGLTLPWTSIAVMAFLVPLTVGVAVALVFRNGRPAVSRRI